MTELIWDGKYDKDGRKVAPVRVALPFQTVETVNEGMQERQRALDLFAEGRESEWRNRLIWGDKKYVLPSLLPEFAGQVNLIYIDPPFDTGADFSFMAKVPDSEDSFTKEPSLIEQKAYRDTWGKGLDSYLQWFYETVVLLRELLAEEGSICVHLDWHVGHYAKTVLDEVFGTDSFRNEIAWCYGGGGAPTNYYHRKHDQLFWYTKSTVWTFNVQRRPYTEGTRQRGLTAVKGPDYELHEEGAALDDWWADCQKILSPTAYENLKYPTQKPEVLLTRIIQGHTNPDNLVLDCFCGSGTTAAVAEKLNRRWIACDLGRFAIHTTRKRLLSIPNVKPFVVQNLGKYERQAWQKAEFEDIEDAQARDAAYRRFILDLYHANPLSGHTWLHGVKAGRMVHVGTVDAPVTMADVREIAAETWRACGQEGVEQAAADVLGWEFAFELNETAIQMAAEANVELHFMRIPREVLEKKAVEQGDIKFFEMGALQVKWKVSKRALTLELEDFIISPQDVPEDVRRSVKHWEQWIDYWAVDWDNKDDTFHNQWQNYRTRQDPSLQTRSAHLYEEPGEYRVVVKVIDILGNDTTKTITVGVK